MAEPSWLIDLDNTLYSADSHAFDQIDVRMGRYIAQLLDVDRVDARRIQKRYFMDYGTTLSGLIARHDVDAGEFLEFVHDIDVSHIPKDDDLAPALAALPGRKVIYTNGSHGHAQRILAHLGIDHVFDGIFDITAARFEAKPSMSAMEACINQFALRPERTTMIDDMAKNLEPAAALGMHTVWINTGSPWSAVGHGPHVKDEAPDFKTWLRSQPVKAPQKED